MTRTRRRTTLLTAGSVALMLAGCGTTDESSGHAADTVAQAPGSADAPAAVEPAEAVRQEMITTGWARIAVKEPSEAVGPATDIVRELGGQVASSEVSAVDADRRASVSLRVPAEKYDELLRRVGELGDVESTNTQAENVGQELVDLRARQSALQGSIDRLRELMDSAANPQDLLAAEEMMTQRQADLDSLTGQLTYLEDQVAMSTLDVDFITPGGGTESTPGALWRQAVDALATSARALVLIVVALVPWLVLAGLLAWAVTALVRRVRRARRKPVEVDQDRAADS